MAVESREAIAGKLGTVRLTLPASVAGNLDRLETSLAELARRLGHPACATGCDILHLCMEREFHAAGKGEVHGFPSLGDGAGDHVSHHAEPQTVDVFVPREVSDDIGSLSKVAAATLSRLGCEKCSSGFDLRFHAEANVIHFDEQLAHRGHGLLR